MFNTVSNKYVTVKVMLSHYRPDLTQSLCSSIALLLHVRGTRSGWVFSSTPLPHFTQEKTRYPLNRRLGGLQGWSGRAENLITTGIFFFFSIPDRPASSHSLCRLSYPVHFISIYKRILRYNASRFMSLENEFLLLYTYWYSKISFTTCGAFRKHFPHKMLPTDLRIILALFKHSNT